MVIKRILWRRYKIVLLWFSFIIFVIPSSLYFIRPVRNTILQPVWPYSWRSISTYDILRMRAVKPPENVTDLLYCPTKTPPSLKLSDLPKYSNVITYTEATPDNNLFKDDVYAGFLPGFSYKDRQEFVWMFLVLAFALKNANISFFFSNGSLLGVYRHGGLIPWDTDMDLALNVSDWQAARQVLSCIEGFRLETTPIMHWKFKFKDRDAPFIDLFFCAEDDRYVWALTNYIMETLVYEKKDVLPLATASFEGIQVSVPAHSENVLRHEFKAIEYCYPQSKNYVTQQKHVLAYIPCSSLAEVYPIHNLRF